MGDEVGADQCDSLSLQWAKTLAYVEWERSAGVRRRAGEYTELRWRRLPRWVRCRLSLWQASQPYAAYGSAGGPGQDMP